MNAEITALVDLVERWQRSHPAAYIEALRARSASGVADEQETLEYWLLTWRPPAASRPAPAPKAAERCGYKHEQGWTCGREKGHPSVHVPPSRMSDPPSSALKAEETCVVCDGPVVDAPDAQACVAGRHDAVVCGPCRAEIAGDVAEWQRVVAEAAGYINYAEGQGGYEVADAQTVARAVREAIAARDSYEPPPLNSVLMLARRIIAHPHKAVELAEHIERIAQEGGAVSPGLLRDVAAPAPAVGEAAPRPESGPMRFGNDWTGVFIRGDRAGGAAMNLRLVLRGAPVEHMGLEGLARLLESCDERTSTQEPQEAELVAATPPTGEAERLDHTVELPEQGTRDDYRRVVKYWRDRAISSEQAARQSGTAAALAPRAPEPTAPADARRKAQE